MKAFLLYRDRDFDPQQPAPPQAQALQDDLALETLLAAMAPDDPFRRNVARAVVLTSVVDLDTLRYRQAILQDCLRHPEVIQEIYGLTVELLAAKKQLYFYGLASRFPTSVLSSAITMMQLLVSLLKRLAHIAEEHAHVFQAEGFVRLFAMLRHELDAAYFAEVQEHLSALRFRNGVLLSAELGRGNEGVNYVLRKPNATNRGWVRSLIDQLSPGNTLYIADRDQAGARALSELRDRGVNLVANALAQSADHVESFFAMLRVELAFYLGCLQLHGRLLEIGAPITFPEPAALGTRVLSARGLYDAGLALQLGRPVVGNDIAADDKDLVVVTGANQGGKSTFLRGLGLAQLMMQCGMFVPAEAFTASVASGIFTHYRREEDTAMRSGKLDEELGRMSAIVDLLRPHALVLLNESFAATNEREGSEIAQQIVRALVERGIRVGFVTHLFEFARQEYERGTERTLFLRAERRPDGARTFRLLEGEPLQTSYGEDVYTAIFGAAAGIAHRT